MTDFDFSRCNSSLLSTCSSDCSVSFMHSRIVCNVKTTDRRAPNKTSLIRTCPVNFVLVQQNVCVTSRGDHQIHTINYVA